MMKGNMRRQQGLTLTELLVVLVIIGILVAIALPNFVGAQDRAKLSSVKANMHTLQTMIESYAIDWGGVYASDMNGLHSDAVTSARAYWKEFKNPYTGQTGLGRACSDAAVLPGANEANGGLVLYSPSSDGSSPILTYHVYGLDRLGSPILHKGQPLALTNS